MTEIGFALLAVLLILIFDLIIKHRQTWIYYIRIFFVIIVAKILTSFMFLESIETIAGDMPDEMFLEYYDIDEIAFLKTIQEDKDRPLTKAEIKKLKEEIKKHTQLGQKNFNEAEDMCVLIPEKKDRDKAQLLFNTAVATSMAAVGGASAFRCIVSGLMFALCAFLNDVWDKWDEMDTLLKRSEMHFGIAAEYRQTLEDHGVSYP